jgi:hypothetical protein
VASVISDVGHAEVADAAFFQACDIVVYYAGIGRGALILRDRA